MSSRTSSIAHMCGIAGYSFARGSRINRTLAAQALLAGIAERGADAVGYAYRGEPGAISVHKQRSGASKLLGRISISPEANQTLIHVRDYTKGHPRIAANNHPVRHGAVKGVHNGIIVNDEEIFAAHGFQRQEPQMATAWFDDREPDTVYIARGVGRPLWLGATKQEAFFASTRAALEVVERYLEVKLHKRELPEGIFVPLVNGRRQKATRFRPDHAFEETPLPAVRAPQEGATCLRRLAAIAAAL